MKRRITPVLNQFFLISVVLFLLLFPWTAHAQADSPEVRSNRVLLWVVVVTSGLLYCLFGAMRWVRIARAAGSEATAKQHVLMWLGGESLTRLFFILPIGVLYRWVLYSRNEGRPIAFFGALVIEKAIGLCSVLIVLVSSIVVLLLEGATPFARFRTLVFSAIGMAMVALLIATLLRPRALAFFLALVPTAFIRKRTVVFLDSLAIYTDRSRALLPVLGLSIGMHAAFFTLLAGAWGLVVHQTTFTWLSYLQAGLWYVSPIVDRLLVDTSLAAILNESGGEQVTTAALFVTYFRPLFLVFPVVFIAAWVLTRRTSWSVSKHWSGTAVPSFDWRYAVVQTRDITKKCFIYVPVGAAVAGFFIGVLEAHWLIYWGHGYDEFRVVWWAPIAYALLGAVTGPFLGLALAYVFGLRQKATPRFHIALVSMALWLAAGVVVVGRYRYIRDLLNDQPMSVVETLVLGGMAVAIATLLTCLVSLTFSRFKARTVGVAIAVIICAIVLTVEYYGFATGFAPKVKIWGARPHVVGPTTVFIVVDTLRADYLEMYESRAEAETPYLDAFRNDSILFKNFYATAPWTKPSFASMFSGLYPTEHAAIGKGSVLPEAVHTLPEIFSENDWYTYGFPNNPNIHAQYGFAQGFERYTDLSPAYPFLGARSVFGTALYQVLRRVRAAWLYPKVEVETHYQPAEYVTDTAESWLATHRPPVTPFFLFLHYMDPHDPYMPGDDSGHGMSLMELGLHPEPDQWRVFFHEAYIDEIERLDTALGDLFAALRERDLYEKSLIVLVSDHGEEFFEHGGWWHGMTLYEEMLRVPCLIKLPENTRAGETFTELASQVDLAPTILDVVGIETDTKFSGRSLFSQEPAATPQEVFAESNFVGARLRALRRGDLKYIEGRSPVHAPHTTPMLFDLETDAVEQQNLAGEHENETLMHERLQEWEEQLRSRRVH